MSSNIEMLIANMKAEWHEPRDRGGGLSLACRFSDVPASESEIQEFASTASLELHEFWRVARSAVLFLDVKYGQWGVEVLSPQEVVRCTERYRRDREKDVVGGDLVIGKFKGDSDLLLQRCDRAAADYGNIIVAKPLDDRADWDNVADTFSRYLSLSIQSFGAKYWE